MAPLKSKTTALGESRPAARPNCRKIPYVKKDPQKFVIILDLLCHNPIQSLLLMVYLFTVVWSIYREFRYELTDRRTDRQTNSVPV